MYICIPLFFALSCRTKRRILPVFAILAGKQAAKSDSISQRVPQPPRVHAPFDRDHMHRDTDNTRPIACDTQNASAHAYPIYSNLGDNPQPNNIQFDPTQGLLCSAQIYLGLFYRLLCGVPLGRGCENSGAIAVTAITELPPIIGWINTS